MAVNVFKDTTFFKVHVNRWDDTKSPNEKIPGTPNNEKYYDGKQIVLVLTDKDGTTPPEWYVWLESSVIAERGWYKQTV